MMRRPLIRQELVRTTAIVALLLILGCRIGAHSTPSIIDTNVQEYLRIALELGQRDVDSLDYSYNSGSASATRLEDPPSLPEIRRAAVSLIAQINRTTPSQEGYSSRNEYLSKQLEAVVSRVDVLQGRPAAFDQETAHSFGIVVPAEYDQRKIKEIRREIDLLIPGRGTLADRYQKFDARFVIPAATVPAFISKALDLCRKETLSHINLPAGEHVTVEYVRNRPWSAYSWYKGSYQSVIQINSDFPLTVDRALNLACHEGYPGHHAYNSMREAALVKGMGLAEYSVQPTYSPQSLISESMATVAADVAFPPGKRLEVERDVLLPIAGLKATDVGRYLKIEMLVDQLHPVELRIARDYLDGRLEFERAGGKLEHDALMAHPEADLKYVNEYRSYVTTYTYGRDLIFSEVMKRGGSDSTARWRAYSSLMLEQHPLSTETWKSVRAVQISRSGG